MKKNYVNKILTSRVYDVAKETPLEYAPILSQKLGNHIFLKREDTQKVFSFKIRGAYNKMANLSLSQLKKGVICASAGNHAQGVAMSAYKLGCKALIVMPKTTPIVKVNAVKAYGVKVVLYGETYSEAYMRAIELEKKFSLCFIHPFDDPDVIAGQGTVGMEILRQHSGPIHAIFIAVGGGGLIGGVASFIKSIRPDIKIIGVQTFDSDAMTRSLKAGRRIKLKEVGLFSDGTSVNQVSKETFRLAKEFVDEMIIVSDDSICAAIRDVFIDTRSILEPAGALAIAGAKSYLDKNKNLKSKNVISIACGANMNFNRLRFVAERAEFGELNEAIFAITIPEEKGSFKYLCSIIGQRSITEFNYRISNSKIAHVFVGLEIKDKKESKIICKKFINSGLEIVDLTDDEFSKLHIRHLVGGKSSLSLKESIYRFEFPERPGALLKFLQSLEPNWNITLFHYRNQGGDIGRVLVGLQIPNKSLSLFKAFLKKIGYRYWNETNNPAYKIFL
tara:strand:- start:1880 stop:3391 length:1512 start_codon:yes stop_codon:yes gene_type:complete